MVALAWAHPASALQLAALYDGACSRNVGVILRVDDSRVYLLGLDGEIREHRRFDIVYLAYYPAGAIPVERLATPERVEAAHIRTRQGGEIVHLATGWLIDHSDSEMSFLGLDGREAVIRIGDIWGVEFAAVRDPPEFRASGIQSRYAHPYPFRFCDEAATPEGARDGPRTVYPQQLLADPLAIKGELDRLQAGHDRLAEFARSEVFYPVPQLYGNDTWLGLWLSAGSRHGASRTRTNTLTPLLVNELSEGPFSFQRVWIAGAAPMPYSVHEEVQTQLYYRLKADYLHFSANYDVARLLIGESRYKWQRGELHARDERWNETFHIAGGLDYDGFALDAGVTTVQYAFRDGRRFFVDRAEMAKFGVFYRGPGFALETYYGLAFDGRPDVEEVAEGSSDEDIEDAEDKIARIPPFSTILKLLRVNASWIDFGADGANRLDYSLIYRTSEFHREANRSGAGEFRFEGRSLTNALYWTHRFDREFSLIGMVSVEALFSRAGVERLGGESNRTYPKAGLGIELRL